MSTRSFLSLVAVFFVAATVASAQPPAPAARTVHYHPRDLITLHTKLRFTTLIVLPDEDEIVEATCGDKDFWIVNAHGSTAYVKPAKPSANTNLNLLTANGRVYTFLLTEISESKGVDPDLAVYVDFDDPQQLASAPSPLTPAKYIPSG